MVQLRSRSRRCLSLLPLLGGAWLLLLPAAGQPQGPDPPGPPCTWLRYNPAPSDCTPFEVLQGETWSRVVLEDRSEEGELLPGLLALGRPAFAAGRSLRWPVTAAITDRVQRCALGHPHLVVELRDLCTPPVEQPGSEMPTPPALPPPPPEPPAADGDLRP